RSSTAIKSTLSFCGGFFWALVVARLRETIMMTASNRERSFIGAPREQWRMERICSLARLWFRRIKIWIFRWRLRARFRAPSFQLRVQRLDTRGLLSGDVVLFVRVIRQIEQLQLAVLEPFDQLPIAVADRAHRRAALIAVMRVVPKERSRLEP